MIFGTRRGTPPVLPDVPRHTIAGYGTYVEAQAAVDYLSDQRFAVEHVAIVGSDLRLVEAVTGRLTNLRAAELGAGSGAWFGLFIGLLVGLFTAGPTWIGLIIGGLIIGAFWGAVFGFVTHLATGGRRDFSSTRALAAARYDVMVDDAYADQARQLLARPR